MPAPQFLAFLPKPVLFGLYGAIGGLLGALVFGEPSWQILKPPPPPPAAQPEPQLAVSASKELQLISDRENAIAVEIERDAFDEDVDLSAEGLPAGVSANLTAATIPKGKKSGKVTLKASGSVSPGTTQIKVIARARAGGKTLAVEAPVTLTVVVPSAPQADVFLVVDVTGSMDWAINGVRDGVADFAAKMRENKIDFRIGLLAFRDLTYDPVPMDLLLFDGQPFTTDVAAFKAKVSRLKAQGGGDIPESSLEAVVKACDQPFRKSATKVLLLITDAPPKVTPGQNMPQTLAQEIAGAEKTAVAVKDKGIDAVHLVVRPADRQIYESLMEAGVIKGRDFDLNNVARGTGFTELIDSFGSAVVEAAAAKNPTKPVVAEQAARPVLTTKSLQSSQQFAAGSEGQLLLFSSIWAGAIAALVCLLLLAGQHHYLRGSMPSPTAVGVGLGGGLLAGLLGGAIGYGLFLAAVSAFPSGGVMLDVVSRMLGFSVLGGLAGVGLSLFIPNLKWIHGLAGGAIGGAVGAVGFILVTTLMGKAVGGTFGDLLGRLAGGLILGFCIGLMVALVEAAFRRAWLEVRYGSRETITVNLGPEPVKIGGDNRMCTVWARGAAPVALRYFIRSGQVVCEDAPRRSEELVRNGDTREVGNVTVTVRTGSSAAPVQGGASRPTAAPPVPRTAATPASPPSPPRPLSLDPFDDDPFPLPMSPTTAARPAPTPAAPAAPPRPAPAAPTAAPPRPPAPTVGAKPPAPPAPTAAPPRPPAPTVGAKPPVPPTPTVGAKPPAPPAAAPKPASPPPAAKPPAGPRDPDACPTCGRKNPGRPGSRYCMLCDQSY